MHAGAEPSTRASIFYHNRLVKAQVRYTRHSFKAKLSFRSYNEEVYLNDIRDLQEGMAKFGMAQLVFRGASWLVPPFHTAPSMSARKCDWDFH